MAKKIVAGAAKVLAFSGGQLIAVYNTLAESAFNSKWLACC